MDQATVSLRQTPLHEVHRALGAKMVPFAGYEMPVQYTGLRAEHAAVREAVGLFDVSHMGELWISGEGATEFLQHQLAGDVEKAFPGKALYTCFLNEEGGIVEDLLVYGFEDRYLLVVNASNRADVVAKMSAELPDNVNLEDASDRTALLALQGPNSDAVMQAVGLNLTDLKYYHHKAVSLCGVPIHVGATGYTGERGFELYVPSEKAGMIWAILMEAGRPSGLLPCGLGARDTLRLEKGFCLHGNDMDANRTPVEAGLTWTVGWKTEFRGKSALVKQKADANHQKLVGFKMTERGIPRKGYPIVSESGQQIGVVTSGTQSPTLGEAIGLGYVDLDRTAQGTSLAILIRDKPIGASVVKVPFL
ncbi:glycine cleavage system aminomethyltransferase GcvT [Flavobacteriales bacterium]|nr:glycine cleavage system aminomethyltransferase GcvT [Flavobacteriales bacterium]